MRKWRWGVCALACAWMLGAAGNALAAPAQPEMSGAVAQVATVAARQGAPAALHAAEARGLDVRNGLVHVVVQSSSPETLAAGAAVVSSGGRIDASNGDLVSAAVPPTELATLAAAHAVSLVRAPFPHVAEAVNGEEVVTTNAAALQRAGNTGAGTKIAIVDVGFGDLAAKEASGEIPAGNVTEVDMCPTAGINSEVHGTAVAEIAHEMAPDAQLYLICIEDEVTLGQAEQYAKAHGITIISHSVGWFNTSRGDGSGGPGTPDAIAADAAANGILWFNAAGNEAQDHWSGTFTDNGSGLNVFSPSAGARDGFLVGGNNGIACVYLKWDAWTGPPQDFDLQIVDGNGNVVSTSATRQTAGVEPTEEACVQNAGPAPATAYAQIRKVSATASPRFDMFAVDDVGPLDVGSANGSVVEPASSPAVVAVGASCWQSRSVEQYSAEGPTIDGRPKPDLAAPDSVSTATYGPFAGCGAQQTGFAGTSAATPAAAAAAALVWSAHPSWTRSQILDELKASATDAGNAGVDNQYGSGNLHLASPATHLAVAVETPALGRFVQDRQLTVTVTALDDSNTIVPSYRGTVHFASSDSRATLPSDYTFTAADNGRRSFGDAVTVHALGTQTITVTDTAGSVPAGTATIDVTPLDDTPPQIFITHPNDLSVFQGEPVDADYSCRDDTGGSGIASCVGDVPVGAPIDTSSVGTFPFTVRAADVAGNTATKTVQYTVVARPQPPVDNAGGGSTGGGGGGGVPPDLHVDLTANATAPPATGTELVYQAKVTVKNVGSASAVRLDLQLPAGFTVTRTYADRGAGCSGAAPALSCDVAWIVPGTGTTVTVWGTVGQAGELDATATAVSLVEKELDPSDNTTTLKLVPAAPPVTPTPPPATHPAPVLSRPGGTFTPPLRAVRAGKTALVRTSVTVNEPVSLSVTAVDTTSKRLTLLAGSKVGTSVAAKPETRGTYALGRAGAVPLQLRLRYAALKRGHVYRIVVAAKAADGKSSTLVVQFRL